MAISEHANEEISRTIDAQRTLLAEETVALRYQAQPDLATSHGPAGRAQYVHDVALHVSYLSQSIGVSTPALFVDFVVWAKLMLAGRNVPAEELAASLGHLRDAVQKLLPASMQPIVLHYIDAGLKASATITQSPPSCLPAGEPHEELAKQYLEALLAADRDRAGTLIFDAVRAGVSVKDLYLHVFQRSQEEVGRLWHLNQVSVAQEHYCTAATQLIMSQLYPHIFTSQKHGRTLVAAGVAGELHELGGRMLADFFEMAGWKTVYLGANTPIQGIIRMMIEQKADVLALSATMPYHVQAVADAIKAVRSSEAKHVKILVGGYPFNRAPDLWAKIGADGHAVDAAGAIAVADDLLGV